MECEICHKAEAATVLVRKNVAGEDEELFVCKACKSAARHAKKEASAPAADGDEPHFAAEVFGPGGEEPPAFVKDLVDATIGFVKGLAQSEKKSSRKCPVCGRTWEEVADSEALGCPNCWKVFAKDLRGRFLAQQYGPKHAGKIPDAAESPAGESREWLERELKKAVDAEDFRKAAELRRKLDGLEGRA
ncbi:MAG: UvrB/UvrC motif-containing protein [Kiritimatiellae bacterium]|nr:UvrB/UvrC motif-containing protein [Kiritimatiellia bacterium]